MKKHEYATPELLFLCTLWFMLGMVAWKYGSMIVGWMR